MAKTVDVFKRFGDHGSASGVTPDRRSAPRWMSSFALRLLVGAAVVAVLPFVLHNNFYLYTLTGGAILLMAVLGLNLAISGGIISIGTAGFLLIGAYASALAQTRWHWNPLPATLLAAAVCAAVGLVTAFPALKMGPFAVAVVTLMYATVAADLILRFTSFTGWFPRGGGPGHQLHAKPDVVPHRRRGRALLRRPPQPAPEPDGPRPHDGPAQ